ncbi:uncharacterized protein LOC142323959 [Lycorma delicatula]|uniref:uncharacterized protein LOC142323959 n=1 Tax=Lycorma delicatula TaxID=130591 RepID=UPI003F50E8AA
MAHSSFIDCEVGNGLTENFIAEGELKVEIETQQVNDDENVAVEVLGQLGGNYESGTDDLPSLIPIKGEGGGFTYVHEVHVEHCISEDDNVNVNHINPTHSNNIIIENDNENNSIINNCNSNGKNVFTSNSDHMNTTTCNDNMVPLVENRNSIVNNDNNIVDHNDGNNLLINDINNYIMSCSICGLRFKDEVELQNHIMTHHTHNVIVNRPYKCCNCAMSFQRKSSLKNHSKIHTYGIISSTFNKNVDNNVSAINNNSKQKVDNSCNKRRSNNKNNKKSDNGTQDRIPPFETLKPNTVVTNANYSLDNNLFDDWIKDIKPEPNDNVTVVDNCIKPVTEITNVMNANFDSMNHHPAQNQRQAVNLNPQQNNTINSKEKPYVCPFCNRTFAREKALLNHIRIHNDNYDMTLECQKCHDVFDDIISLQAHLVACVLPESSANDHHPPPESPEYVPYEHKRHTFINNNNSTSSSSNNNNNSNINENVGDHVCQICNKRFKTRQKVFRHMWVHRRKMYTCEVCGLSFPGVKYLDEHRLALHPSKAPFACDTCGKSFMSKQGLTEHSRLHKGWSDQYYCNYCEKFFSSRQGFTIHGRIHTDERPYGCKYCTKSFRDGGTLKKHERIHTGERPHECPLCHKRYNQKVVLREHIRGVHVMKRNSDINGKCPVCGINNMDKEELSEHIVRHSDELMKKIKEEYLMKQKNLEKTDKTIINRKRRNRVLKKVNTNERLHDKNDNNNDNKSGDEFLNNRQEDDDYIYPYKIPVVRQAKRRSSGRRRPYDKKNTVTKANNQKKKVDNRYEPKKTKKVLKYASSKKSNSNNNNNAKQCTNNFESTTASNNIVQPSFLMDETCSENSSNHFEIDPNKKCLVDFTQDLQPLKLLECEMCHARFLTRSELITHVLVHI